MKVTASIAWTIAVALVCIIICMTVIVVSGHDVTIFVVAIGLLLTSATGFIAVFHNQRKTDQTLQVVKRQTNGTLSRVLDSYERAVAREAVVSATGNPDVVAQLHEHTLGADEIAELRERIK